MAQNGFARAYARVRIYEGGNVDDPRDPGGRTSRGVTQRVYTAWLRRKGLPSADVWTAPAPHVTAIYRELYWDRVQGDALPAGVDFAVFDAAINSGVGQAAKWLQRALPNYGGQIDGSMGPATLTAVEDDADNDALIARMAANRYGTLRKLKTWGTYSKGWSARIANVQKIGQAWASGSVGPAPIDLVPLGGNRKAVVSEATVARPLLSVNGAGITTAASSVGTAASDLATKFEVFRELFGWMPYVLGGLAILSAVAGVIVMIGHSAADRAEAGKVTKPIDLAADEDAIPVAVNDNAGLDLAAEAA